jgi:hypothetical protein
MIATHYLRYFFPRQKLNCMYVRYISLRDSCLVFNVVVGLKWVTYPLISMIIFYFVLLLISCHLNYKKLFPFLSTWERERSIKHFAVEGDIE